MKRYSINFVIILFLLYSVYAYANDTRSPLSSADINPNYFEKAMRIIKKHWNPPAEVANYEIILDFKIYISGEIKDVKIVNSSRNFYLDQLALRCLMWSSPLPPLSKKYPYKFYESRIRLSNDGIRWLNHNGKMQ